MRQGGSIFRHYVHGVPRGSRFPPVVDLISGTAAQPAPHGYASLEVTKAPGTAFHYSGGGFLVLQHLVEATAAAPVADSVETDRYGFPQSPPESDDLKNSKSGFPQSYL